MAEDNGMNGDDVGWWDCSLCTYRNSAEKFKCEICDLRRGTSTRKPRCSADTIVAQVVKQQEQIRQQTKAKPSPKSKSGGGSGQASQNPTTTNNDSSGPTQGSVAKKAKKSKNNHNEHMRSASNLDESSDDDDEAEAENEDIDDEDDASSVDGTTKKQNKSKRKKKVSSSNKTLTLKKQTSSKSRNNNNANEYEDDMDPATSTTDELSLSPNPNCFSPMSDCSQYSSSSAMTPEPTTSFSQNNHSSSATLDSNKAYSSQDSPFKIRPVEINGNLIKYLPPTSTGRTGLIIDKKRFTQHSVTVDDVTITFTEFATRQNKYVRKKKKRSGKAAINPSSVKVEPKISTSNNHSNDLTIENSTASASEMGRRDAGDYQ